MTRAEGPGGRCWRPPSSKGEREEINPFLERLWKDLGPSLSGISHQSDGLRGAFREVFPGVYLLLCHFHVLRSIGESLAGLRYARFKTEVDRSGVKGRLNRFVRRLRKERGKSREARQSLKWTDKILICGKAARAIPTRSSGRRWATLSGVSKESSGTSVDGVAR